MKNVMSYKSMKELARENGIDPDYMWITSLADAIKDYVK